MTYEELVSRQKQFFDAVDDFQAEMDYLPRSEKISALEILLEALRSDESKHVRGVL
jgi:hypothetical protein